MKTRSAHGTRDDPDRDQQSYATAAHLGECRMSEMISDYAGDMGSIRQRMVEHPAFVAIRNIHSLWIFMQAHLSHG
jgi:hypothetical protein